MFKTAKITVEFSDGKKVEASGVVTKCNVKSKSTPVYTANQLFGKDLVGMQNKGIELVLHVEAEEVVSHVLDLAEPVTFKSSELRSFGTGFEIDVV